MRYQTEVGQSFLDLQTRQQAQLATISGSLGSLVTAANRFAAAAEDQANTQREIKILLLSVNNPLYILSFCTFEI